MKTWMLSLLLSAHWLSPPKVSNTINPTGTYLLRGQIKNHEILGHSGELRAKLVSPGRVALSFFITRGFPDYDAGSFLDTLNFDENVAKYHPPTDAACQVLFVFSGREVEIQQVYTHPDCHCGFGKGVLISTSFEKNSSDMPIIQDLARHGRGQ